MTDHARRALRILVITHHGFTESQVGEIRAATPGAEYVTATDDTVHDKAEDIDALIGCPRRAFSEKLLDRAGSRLRWIHATGAGVEEFLTPRLVESEIVLTNGRIIQGPEVADHAMALLLVARRAIAAGEKIAEDAIAVKRPRGGMQGLPPIFLDRVVGLRAARDIAPNEPITLGLVVE